MEKTSMTEMLNGNIRSRKRGVRPSAKHLFSQTLGVMPRDPQNPVKMRAMRRARELGKTLGQVYREADCNKAYLTEVPKTGWRENKLQAIAKALAWTIDELMRDDEDDRKTDNSDLLEMAIDVAAELLERAGGTRAKPPELAWATRLIYEVLREIAAGGGQISTGNP